MRNLETAEELAQGKEYAVMVIAEEQITSLSSEDIRCSFPHLLPEHREELMGHYLGCFTWERVCEATGVDFQELPDTTSQVVANAEKWLSFE